MNFIHSICLASPLHDPEARLYDLIAEWGKNLISRYDGFAVVSISPTTSPRISELLLSMNYIVKYQKNVSPVLLGDNYLNAIKHAIDQKTRFVHLVDFDRALHWIKRFPREYRDVIKILPEHSGFVSFVRTKRAFETHPQTQRTTENIINAIASEIAGHDLDIMSGSFGFEINLAKKIVQETKRKDYGVYAEFLRIALKHNNLISVIEVDGLEWETPDQYRNEIMKESYSTWLANFQSLSEWEKRVQLLEESSSVLMNKNNKFFR